MAGVRRVVNTAHGDRGAFPGVLCLDIGVEGLVIGAWRYRLEREKKRAKAQGISNLEDVKVCELAAFYPHDLVKDILGCVIDRLQALRGANISHLCALFGSRLVGRFTNGARVLQGDRTRRSLSNSGAAVYIGLQGCCIATAHC